MDVELRYKVDVLEKELVEASARIAKISLRLEALLTATRQPRAAGTLDYMSGRWKRRDGTGYGR